MQESRNTTSTYKDLHSTIKQNRKKEEPNNFRYDQDNPKEKALQEFFWVEVVAYLVYLLSKCSKKSVINKTSHEDGMKLNQV